MDGMTEKTLDLRITSIMTKLFDVHTTPSAIGVLQLLDHACATHCPPKNYTVYSLAEFKRLLN